MLAVEVAQEFCQEMDITAEGEAAGFTTAALMVGELLAEQGHAGDWSRIDIPELYRRVPGRTAEAEYLSVRLIGLLTWMGLSGGLAPVVALNYLAGIEAHGPEFETGRRMLSDAQRVLLEATSPRPICTAGSA